MNQTFSISRFGRLLRKYFTDNRGQLLADLSLLIGCLLVLGIIIYRGWPSEVKNIRSILFFVLGWPCWYMFTVQQITGINQKERAINYLMQPASQFEKISLVWLISGVGFVLSYLLLFFFLDTLGVAFVNNRHWPPDQLAMIREQGGLLKITSFFDGINLRDVPDSLWVFTAILHSFTMAFALFIRRYTLSLIVIIAFTLLLFGLIVNNFLLQSLTGSDTIRSGFPFAEAIAQSPIHKYQYRMVNLPTSLSSQLRYIVGVTAIILLYITAYVRFKEREV
ncbi:hypothetical protein GO755_11095 [Spirosoma sp. HMF4905]|uniref:Uncharacterized protein n=1 Tax=Spirosoma arboris TaxID=2682092 RepID=A0A7K1S9X1_9BACT|nr:hypothetical protein [Spirosoma arboris]MVM30580.1 hypothetical protein [Spirosoma arboris]